jgi:predicted nucleic acid-binding protein
MTAVVYDTGALVAADRNKPAMWEIHAEALAMGVRPIVPVVVLAQAWRGGPQHNLSRLLRGCRILPDTEETGRTAGIACAAARTSDVIDAIVVATAVRLGDALIVTSDPDDIAHLATSIGAKLPLHTV